MSQTVQNKDIKGHTKRINAPFFEIIFFVEKVNFTLIFFFAGHSTRMTETPWTETPLGRDPLWAETPSGQRPPLDRDSPEQRTETPQRPPWTETYPLNRITDTCKNFTFPQLCLRVVITISKLLLILICLNIWISHWHQPVDTDVPFSPTHPCLILCLTHSR